MTERTQISNKKGQYRLIALNSIKSILLYQWLSGCPSFESGINSSSSINDNIFLLMIIKLNTWKIQKKPGGNS